MTFNGLKQIVYQSLLVQQFTNEDKDVNHTNQILAGVLLIKTLRQLMLSSPKYQDDIKQTASQYAITFKNVAESMGGKFISYKEIKQNIKNYNIKSILDLTETQINEIYKLYENKTEIAEFDLSNYSSRMYNIYKLTEKENNRLSKIHFKVICPIMTYYKTYYGIRMAAINVEDSGSVPAHEIKLSIDGILINQIYNDIERDVMNIQQYLARIDLTPDGSVKILIR